MRQYAATNVVPVLLLGISLFYNLYNAPMHLLPIHEVGIYKGGNPCRCKQHRRVATPCPAHIYYIKITDFQSMKNAVSKFNL